MPHGLPTAIGRYEIQSTLGVGGFAVVVSAYDAVLDATVAIKVLSREGARDADLSDRFLQEARLLRRVQSPHVIAVHDHGVLDDGRPYLVMELAAGGALADRITSSGHALDRDGVARVVSSLANGLAALHAVAVVHRDIKPANLLIIGPAGPMTDATVVRHTILDAGERLVVGDLGLAKDTGRTTVGHTVLGGTLHYQSPEQVQEGAPIGPAADVFAATAVLWTMLTGSPPPSALTLEAHLDHLPASLRDVLRRGLAEDPTDRHPSIGEWLDDALGALDAAPAVGITIRQTPPGATCPFKGLASFQPEDAAYFFGREAMVDELIGRLQSRNTLIIGGPSGSGKSSVLRAGLLPALERGGLPGSETWTRLLWTPGTDCLAELALQLDRLQPDRPPLDPDALRRDSTNVRHHLAAGTRAVLAIDQFEELFTQTDDDADRLAFLGALAALTGDQSSTVRVVLALRADFYATCARYPWLAQRISENQVLVGPMQRTELRRAIEGPAQRAGLRLEPGLADAVLDDAGTGSGTLPLIAHALMETWLRRRGTELTLDGFRAAGGVTGAIAQSAEDAYERLGPAEQTTARLLFLRLVTPGEGGPDTRRLLPTAELDDDLAAASVAATLADDRLVALDERGVQLVHEALITAWPRLHRWLDDARDDLRTRQRLSTAARAWADSAEDTDLLLRGAPLTAAVDWRIRSGMHSDHLVTRFVDTSEEMRAAAEARAAEELHRRRRVRAGASMALSVLALAAVVASVVAFAALRQSRRNEAEAERRFVGALATQAASVAEAQPRLALVLAAESAARAEKIDPEAQGALVVARAGLAASDIVADSSPIPVGDALTVAMSPSGDRFMTGGRDGTVRLWNVATRTRIASLGPVGDGIEEAAFDPTGRWLVVVGRFGIRRWDLDNLANTAGTRVPSPDAAVWSVAFSHGGDRFAIAAEDGTVQQYGTARAAQIGPAMHGDADMLSVAYVSEDARIASGTGAGDIWLWDAGSGALVRVPIPAHGSDDVWELIGSPAGDQILSASSDGTAKVWSLPSGEPVGPTIGAARGQRVAGVAWSRDGRSIVGGGDDGRIRRWDVATGAQLAVSSGGHDDRVIDVSGSVDGTHAVSLGRDQDARLWTIGTPVPVDPVLADLGEPLHGVAVSRDGRTIAAGGDGVVHVVSRQGKRIGEIATASGPVFALAFLDDGMLAIGDARGALQLWDVGRESSIVTRNHAHAGFIAAVAVDRGPDRLVSVGDDGVVRWWDTAGGRLERKVESAPHGEDTDVAVDAKGTVVTAGLDGSVRIWNRDGTPAAEPLAADSAGDRVSSVAVSPDGATIAATTASDGVTLWDRATGRRETMLNGQPTDQLDVAFTPDGATFVSTSRVGAVVLWSAVTGEQLGPRFTSHAGAVWRTAVLPDGTIVTAGEDGQLRALDALDLRRACTLGAGSFDRQARQRFLGTRQPQGCRP